MSSVASSNIQTTTTTTTTTSVLVSKSMLNNISTTPTTSTTTTNNLSNLNNMQHEEKVYKKEKQIIFEFDSKTKDLKTQLNDGIKCLEQRLDTQISILYEMQDFFKKRAEVEAQYSRDLDKLTKQVLARHKSEKSKRETWQFHSAFKLWESLINDTKQHSKNHQVTSEVCSKYINEKFDEIIDDIKRIFSKCKLVGQSLHEEIFKVVGELNGAMKTYHEYQSESKQAEAKLKYVQSQKPKFEKQKSKKKLKQYEKQVEKRLQKYTETKVKAFKARNEYILSIDASNACINKFCTEDIGDLVDCMDFGFHASVARCIYMYMSAQENTKRSRQQTVDNLNRSIGDLDSNADKLNYLDYFSFVFNVPKKFSFEPHKGDEVSQVNAQSLIRYEMEKRFEQLDNRLKTLKAENNEIFKTIEATESSLLNFFDVKNCDMSDLFRDLNLTNLNLSINTKEKRIEIEDYYVEKVRQYTTSSNLIARLESRHLMMQKALCGCVNSDKLIDKVSKENTNTTNNNTSFNNTSTTNPNDLSSQKLKKKIGKSPIIGQPRLFGGKLIEYINATKQEIPPIVTSCVKAINRLGLHNQGIFRIPGSQLEINQFKEAFEKGDDPLITVNPREMNSVAGVLKLYLRELKDPLFPRDMYDSFLNAIRINQQILTSSSSSSPPDTPCSPKNVIAANNNNNNSSESLSSSLPNCIHVENLEAQKVENIKRVVSNIPRPIFIVLRYLFSFLNHLSEFKDENMMDAYNIAICLAPTLIPVPEEKKDQVNHQTDTIEFIKIIIQNSDEIFSMECEGPFYEKFDSEMDNDEIEESDDDEEGDESDRQFLRNVSDDELYVTEAIALYDYKGRSDKEISFKKGDWLAIRGQLSADWWHGSLINPSSKTDSSNNKLGYIPDKYVALRSSKRKLSTSHVSTPQTVHTPSSMSSSMTSSTNHSKTPLVKTLNQQYRENFSNLTSLMDLEKTNLLKESDILNDDENENFNSNNRFVHNSNFMNSLKISNQQAKRNLSASSTLIDNKNDSFNHKNTNSPSMNGNRTLKFDQTLYSNKSKMNHIEDALASVLDDMKQLDFSTNLSQVQTQTIMPAKNMNPIFDTIKKTSLSCSSTPSSYSSQSSASSSSSTTIGINNNKNGILSKNQDDFQLKSNLNNNNNNKENNKRPDLVLDLPVNLPTLLASNQIPAIGSINLNNQFMSTLPNQKVRRKSIDRINTLEGLNKPIISNNINKILVNNNVNDKLHSSSTSSTESSLSSAASLNLLTDQTNSNYQRLANKNLLNSCMAAAEAAANAALLNNKTIKLSSDEIISNNNKIINQSTPKSAPENQLHAFNFDANQAIENQTVSSLTSSSSPLFKMTDNVFTDSSDDKLTSTNEHKFKNQLNQFKNSNYCTTNDLNFYALELNDNVLLKNDEKTSIINKKNPPPIMKKPEKSLEVMRKLSQTSSSPVDEKQQSNKSLDSSSSTISSLPSTETNGSPVNNDSSSNSKTNISIKLSNSKATDV